LPQDGVEFFEPTPQAVTALWSAWRGSAGFVIGSMPHVEPIGPPCAALFCFYSQISFFGDVGELRASTPGGGRCRSVSPPQNKVGDV
jgi:hypothetical protein